MNDIEKVIHLVNLENAQLRTELDQLRKELEKLRPAHARYKGEATVLKGQVDALRHKISVLEGTRAQNKHDEDNKRTRAESDSFLGFSSKLFE